MNLVQKVLVGLLALLLLLAVIGFFLPSEMKIVSETTIAADQAVVFNTVDDFEAMHRLSVWHQMDKGMNVSFIGHKGEPGYQFVWSSDNPKLGAGIITRVETHPYEFIINEAYFKDWEESWLERWDFSLVKDSTKVTWSISDSLGNNIVMRYMSLMMTNVIQSQLDTELSNLKKAIEIGSRDSLQSDSKTTEPQE